jgi:hypothetical protein
MSKDYELDYNEQQAENQKEKTALRRMGMSRDKYNPERLHPYGFGNVPQDEKRK